MPVTITFHRISEKKPEHNETIIWLSTRSSFGQQYFSPREVNAEYYWQGVIYSTEGNLYPTGQDICYSPEDEQPEPEDTGAFYQLALMTNHGDSLSDDDLWISQEDYWTCFE